MEQERRELGSSWLVNKTVSFAVDSSWSNPKGGLARHSCYVLCHWALRSFRAGQEGGPTPAALFIDCCQSFGAGAYAIPIQRFLSPAAPLFFARAVHYPAKFPGSFHPRWPTHACSFVQVQPARLILFRRLGICNFTFAVLAKGMLRNRSVIREFW